MSPPRSRRDFLRSAAAGGAILGLGDLSFLSRFRPVTAAEARLDPKVVRLAPEIEPAVRLLEETPRERLLEEVASRIQRGMSYREILAALLLAGVRNIQPRPQVGFKFHAVLVVNSAHLASLSSPDAERWLPIFWALDYFKDSQARDEKEGDWTMGPVKEDAVPPAHRARAAFIEAMDGWDEGAADAAVAGLVRSAGAQEIFELFSRYGARDFRSIGHKAIYVSNSWRTLNAIGWQHAEPVLRSLAYALLSHEGDNPEKRDDPPDRSWRRNEGLAAQIRPGWQGGKESPEAAREMLAVLRQGSDEESSKKAVELLNGGAAPQSIWDGFLGGAAELLLRQPGILSLHAVTTTNALQYAFRQVSGDDTRRRLLLQNGSFIPLFREAAKGRGSLGPLSIEGLEPLELKAEGPGAVEEIFAEVSRDRLAAARKTLAYLKSRPEPRELFDAARLLVFFKGNDAHDYKFSSAVLEDYFQASPAWRARYLAASMFSLTGSGAADNGLVKRTRAALRGRTAIF
jgi:hypothetical protein